MVSKNKLVQTNYFILPKMSSSSSKPINSPWSKVKIHLNFIQILKFDYTIHIACSWAAGAYPRRHRAKAGNALDKFPQFIAGRHRDKQPFALTFTPMNNLEFPIELTCIDCGRKPKKSERRPHTETGCSCKLHTQMSQAQNQIQNLFGLWFALTTVSPILMIHSH